MATQWEKDSFAKNLKRVLKNLRPDWKQADLARAIWKKTFIDSRGYEQPYGKDQVSDWINAKKMPREPTVVNIAEAIGCHPFELLEIGQAPMSQSASPIAEPPSYSYRNGRFDYVASASAKISPQDATKAIELLNSLHAIMLPF